MSMMRSEDGVSISIHGREYHRSDTGYPVGRAKPVEEIPTGDSAGRRLAEAIEEERAKATLEPYALDDAALKDDDARVRAYMEIHEPYAIAYNAIKHRDSVDWWTEAMDEIFEAFMGRQISLAEFHEESANGLSRLLHTIRMERQRLLSQMERNTETLAVQSSSINSQQKLISELSMHATRGKRAHDAFMLLAIRLGIDPVPQNPEEFASSVLAAFAANQKGIGK